MAGMRTQNFKKIAESRKKMPQKKKKSFKDAAIDSIQSAFDFRDRNEPKEEPIKGPSSTSDAFKKSLKSRKRIK